MQVTVTQRFPAPENNNVPQTVTISSVDQVYNIPWVQRWVTEPTFSRLYKSIHPSSPHLLVAETNRSTKHWAIATIAGDVEELQLPEWKKQ